MVAAESNAGAAPAVIREVAVAVAGEEGSLPQRRRDRCCGHWAVVDTSCREQFPRVIAKKAARRPELLAEEQSPSLAERAKRRQGVPSRW